MNERALVKINPRNAGHVQIKNYNPQYWFQWGYVVIEPVPDSEQRIKLFVADWPSNKITTGQPTELPKEFWSCIIDFACWVLSMKLGKWNQAAGFYNEYIAGIRKRRNDYIRRRVDTRAIQQIPNNIQRRKQQ